MKETIFDIICGKIYQVLERHGSNMASKMAAKHDQDGRQTRKLHLFA